MDYLTAFKANSQIQELTAGHHLTGITDTLKEGALAWNSAPGFGNFRMIANIPALFIVVIITYLVYIGIRETKKLRMRW